MVGHANHQTNEVFNNNNNNNNNNENNLINFEEPQLSDCLKTVLLVIAFFGVPYLQITWIRWHSTSWRMKEGKDEEELGDVDCADHMPFLNGWMFFHPCLPTRGSEMSSQLEGPGPH